MKIGFILVALLISGCATYLEPDHIKMYSGEKNLSELSAVATDYNVWGVTVYSIDGVWVNSKAIDQISKAGESGFRNWRGILLEPGTHSFTIVGQDPELRKKGLELKETVSKELLAGHSYIFYVKKVGEEYVFELFDAGKNYNQDCLIATYPDNLGYRKRAKGCAAKPMKM